MHRNFVFFAIVSSLLYSGCNPDKNDTIVIPDPQFLASLIENGIDTNKDGIISFQEANASRTIVLESSGISSLSGLENFIELDTLIIRRNYLPEINLSGLASLRYLEITACETEEIDISENSQLLYLDVSGGASMSNRLENLDISKNFVLEVLKCSENKLPSLNLANNPSLRELICGRNMIRELDVSANHLLEVLVLNNNFVSQMDLSNNPGLIKMISCGNQLTSLDLSGNQELINIGIDNMSSLHEVCVWTLPFPPPGISILMSYSPNVYFTDQCR